MAVYIDNFYVTGAGKFGRMKMSHMIADNREELYAMVDKIKVQRKWIQDFGTTREHFDVCMEKRVLAIKHGAIPIGFRELSEKTITRVYEGKYQPLYKDQVPFKRTKWN